MNVDGIIGALHHPDDGHIAPADVTQAMAAGERYLAKIIADSPYDPQNLVQA